MMAARETELAGQTIAEKDASVAAKPDELFRLRAAHDAALSAAQDAIRDTTRLTRLLTILSEPAPTHILLDRVLATLSELFTADIVVLLDPAGTGSFSPLASIGLPEYLAGDSWSDAEGSFVAEAMRSRIPLLSSNASQEPQVDPQLRELEAEATIWLPVIGNFAARGVLVLARCRSLPFTHADTDLLTAMTYRIGLTLEQSQRSVQLENIVRSGQELGRHLDESAVCSEAVQMFPGLVGANAAALYLLSENELPQLVSLTGLDPACNALWDQVASRLQIDEGSGNHLPFSTQELHTLLDPQTRHLLDKCPVQTLLAVPIRKEDQLVGLLLAMRFTATSFSFDTVQVAMLFASQASAALQNARLYRVVKDELSERKKAEQALRASDGRFRALIRSVSDVITILDSAGAILYASPAVETMWGSDVNELLGQSVLDRIHPENRQMMRTLLADLAEKPDATLTRVVRVRQGAATWRDVEVILANLMDEPTVGGIVATYHDITERRTYEKELSNLAFHDPLTGLANRTHFIQKLQKALDRALLLKSSVAVVFFDLDNFKIVNDSLGHDLGDRVLCAVAERVKACLRREDVAARFGGDEFTILVENVKDVEQVVAVANRLIEILQDPIRLESRDLFVGCSLGIALNNPAHDSPENLLRKADLAMYEAKGSGKGRYAIFDMQLNVTAMERLEMETALRRALKQEEFRVFYQPIVALDNGRITQVEALLRWEHPARGLLGPEAIIHLAEETGLIIEIGQWVLEQACKQVHSWHRRYPSLPDLVLNVNLSLRQFQHASLLDDIDAALRTSDLDPSSLMLEITESSLIHNPTAMIAKLDALKDTGVQLAIDDFGTGYASLSYLKQFPVDALKIDKDFIQGILRDGRDRAIVETMIDLAEAFGLKAIGEGIETNEQAAQLHGLGCRLGQGYLFARPLPADQFESLLAEN